MTYKFFNINISCVFLLVTIFIAGCGGGGSSSDTSSSASQTSQANPNSSGQVTSNSKNADNDHGAQNNSDSFPQDTNAGDGNRHAGDSGNSDPCSLCDRKITLSWDANPEPEVIGYEVWYSMTPDANDLQFFQDLNRGQPDFEDSSPHVTYSALTHLSIDQGNICFAVKAYSNTMISGFSELKCSTLG